MTFILCSLLFFVGAINSAEKISIDKIEFIGLYEGSNPVIAHGTSTESDYRIREIGNIIYEPGEASKKYKTFYTGYITYTDADDGEKIHYAYSEDGHTWTKSTSNPVIDNRLAEDPFVVKSGSTYYLYAEDKTAGGENKIRIWTSSDCEIWADQGQAIDLLDCQSPIVWIENTVWYMICERYPNNQDIALATSSDGMTWNNEPTNPIMEKTDTDWVIGALVSDDIIKEDGIYYMTYHGESINWMKTGIATSTNLIDWNDSSNSPIQAYNVPAITSIETASVFNDTENIFLYYGGDDTGIYRGYPLGNVPKIVNATLRNCVIR